jgi:hypothetical protein
MRRGPIALGFWPRTEGSAQIKDKSGNTQILILRTASAMAFLTIVLLVQAIRQFKELDPAKDKDKTKRRKAAARRLRSGRTFLAKLDTDVTF